MNEPDQLPSETALTLAKARLHGHTSLGAVPLEDAEQAAAVNGRTITVADQPGGATVVLGWPAATDPAPRGRSPRLRRSSPPGLALKTFLIAYAALTEPHRPVDEHPGVRILPTSELYARAGRLLGTGARPRVVAALRRDLPHADLLTPWGDDAVALGPAVAGWDELHRRQIDQAAARLRAFPLWSQPESSA